MGNHQNAMLGYMVKIKLFGFYEQSIVWQKKIVHSQFLWKYKLSSWFFWLWDWSLFGVFRGEHAATPIPMVKEQFFYVREGHPLQASTQHWNKYIGSCEGLRGHTPVQPELFQESWQSIGWQMWIMLISTDTLTWKHLWENVDIWACWSKFSYSQYQIKFQPQSHH